MPMIRQPIRSLDDIDALNKIIKPGGAKLDRGGGYKEHIWEKLGIPRPFHEHLGTIELGTEVVEEEKPKPNRIERIPTDKPKRKKKKK